MVCLIMKIPVFFLFFNIKKKQILKNFRLNQNKHVKESKSVFKLKSVKPKPPHFCHQTLHFYVDLHEITNY